MLTIKQQKDLDDFRNITIEIAHEMYPDLVEATCISCIALGAAMITSFLQQHPDASVEAITEHAQIEEEEQNYS